MFGRILSKLTSRPGGSHRLGRRVYRLERLEERWVFNSTSPIRPANVDAAEVAVPLSQSTQGQEVAPQRFASSAALRQWLEAAADERYGHLFGKKSQFYAYPWETYFLDTTGILRTMAATATDFDGTPATAFSADNLQVEGVDEADLVETDGKYLYLISGDDLVIVKAGAGADLQVTARVKLDEAPTGMYLDGDRLVLLSSQMSPQPIDFSRGRILLVDDVISYWGEPSAKHVSKVTVLDVADRSAPALVQQLEIEGVVQNSRLVNGQLRLVVTNGFNLPHPERRWVGGEGVEGHYQYESRGEYLSRVLDEIVAGLPLVRDVAIDGSIAGESPLVLATDIYRPAGHELGVLTTVATVDVQRTVPGIASQVAIVTAHTPEVYGTTDSLYFFAHSGAYFGKNASGTQIRKFDFDGATHAVHLAARGEVDGYLLNQFAADEHGDYLRVVTRSWHDGQKLFVLRQYGAKLHIVGESEPLAPGEELHSVRFDGDRAFVVTFRKVDPLFVIDLSDPNQPSIKGELKIPGFSDYLQVIDEHHVLGIGRGADEAKGLFEELQISVFDVSKLSDPELSFRYSIGGGRSTASIATGDRWQEGDGDHLSVGYFPAEKILALPIFNAGGTWWDASSMIDNTPLFDPGEGGLALFRVDTTTGIQSRGILEHDTLIHRSLVVGSNLYALSPGTITVHDIDNPTQELGRLEIVADEQTDYTELVEYVPTSVSTANLLGIPGRSATRRGTNRLWRQASLDAALRSYAVGSRNDWQFLADDAMRSLASPELHAQPHVDEADSESTASSGLEISWDTFHDQLRQAT